MVKIGIIGINQISETFAEAASKVENVKIVSVCSRHEEELSQFVEKYPTVKPYSDLSRMLSDPESEAVYVASPNLLHVSHSKKALLHGKHVLCEKPLAATLQSFEEVCETAAEVRKVYLEAMRPLYDPAMQYVKKELKKIGRPVLAHMDFSQYSSRFASILESGLSGRESKDASHAALIDHGIFPIEWCVALFGDPMETVSVNSLVSGSLETHGSCVLKYASGLVVSVSYSKISDTFVPCSIVGEEGSILIFGKPNAPLAVKTVYRDGRIEKKVFEDAPDNMGYEIAFFRDLCESGEWDHPIYPYMRSSVRVMDQIRRQNAEGKLKGETE